MGGLARRVVGGIMRRGLATAGYSVVPLHGQASDQDTYDPARHNRSGWVPREAERYLHRDNERLVELHCLYDKLDWPVSVHSRWDSVLGGAALNLLYFRGDNPYIWHYHETERVNDLKYFVFLRYVHERDSRGMLETLGEDGAFGAFTFAYPGYPVVGRDLLDSVNELLFLEDQLGVLGSQGLRILDVGAGYGRMAYRVSQAVSSLGRYTCVDAIAESTFLSEYYVRFRELDRVEVVPLPDVPALPRAGFDLAFNIHSFSECPIAAIDWWLAHLARLEVPKLFVVPNEPVGFLSTEPDGQRQDYLPVFTHYGYELVADRRAYEDDAVRELLAVEDRFCLFEQSR